MEDFKFDLILGQGPQARTIEMPYLVLRWSVPPPRPVCSPGRCEIASALLAGFSIMGTPLKEVVTRSAALLNVPCTLDGAAEIAARSRGPPHRKSVAPSGARLC